MDSSSGIPGPSATLPFNRGWSAVSRRAGGTPRSDSQNRHTEAEARVRWIRWVARLYPTAWRKRYGAEFDIFLEDASLGWRDLWDVWCGALKMHIERWSFRKLAIACGLAGAMLGAGVAFRM